MAFFTSMILGVVFTLISELLRPKPDIEDARPAGLGDFRFNTATEGRSVPLIWGTVLIDGPNTVWYGNLVAGPITEKVKTGLFSSDRVVTGFTYRVGIQMALCRGNIDGIRRVRYGKTRELYSGAFTTSAVNMNFPTFFGPLDEPSRGGGFGATMDILTGAQTTVNTYLNNVINDNTKLPSYKGTACAVFRGLNLQNAGAYIGNSPTIQEFDFEVGRWPDSLGLADPKVNTIDANPAEAIYEILTDSDWGMGIDPLNVDAANFLSVANTLNTEGNGFSMRLDSPIEPAELIHEIERQIDGTLYIDLATGKYKLALARNDYTIGSVPQMDETNILEMVSFGRGAWSATANEVRVPFQDASEDFKDTFAIAQDTANFEIQGARRVATVRFPGVKNRDLATKLAWRELRALSYPLAQVKIKVNREGNTFIPSTVFALSWDEFGITQMPMRVTRIDYGTIENGEITIDAVQDVFQPEQSVFDPSQDTEFTEAEQTVTAFTSTDQFAVEIPLLLAKQQPGGESLTYSLVVGGHDAGGTPYRYEQLYGFNPTPSYTSLGSNQNGMCTVGKIRTAIPGFTTSMPAQGAGSIILDPQATSDDLDSLIGDSYTTSAINAAFDGVAVIEPGTANEEWVIFTAVVDNGTGIQLNGVIRGCLDTVPVAHAANATVWLIQTGGLSILDVAFSAADDVSVKLLPASRTDALIESEVTVDIDVILSAANAYRSGKPYPPNELKVNGSTRPSTTNADTDIAVSPEPAGSVRGIALEWTRRDFNNENVYQNALGQDDSGLTTWSNSGGANSNLHWKTWVYDLEANPTPSSRADSFIALNSDETSTTTTGDRLDRDLDVLASLAYIPNKLRFEIESQRDAPVTDNPARSVLVYDVSVTSEMQTPKSLDLNGTDESMRLTTNSNHNIANAWTVEIWIKPKWTGTGTKPIYDLSNSVDNRSRINFILVDGANGSPFRITLYNSAGALRKQFEFGSYTQSAWTCLAFTLDGSADTLKVYQDGSEDTTPNKITDLSITQVNDNRRAFLAVNNAASNYLECILYRVALWDVVRSASSIAESYNSGDGSGFNVLKNGTNYLEAGDLQHMWDWRLKGETAGDIQSIGRDYGTASPLLDLLTNAQNITSADDHSTDVP